jgi:tetratricopeptide (TPR) repeat protein
VGVMAAEDNKRGWTHYFSSPLGLLAFLVLWLLVFIVTAWWIWYTGRGSPQRVSLLAAAGIASFMLGCLAGFLFSSYGEETSTIGKIRDWLIGGITGVGVSQLIDQGSALKRMLGTFMLDPKPNDFALVTGVTVSCSCLGFFFMFFTRELFVNVFLAQSRAERGRVEGTLVAGQVAQHLLLSLPASILSGVDNIGDILDPQKADKLRAQLYGDDVQKFLDEAQEIVRTGGALDWNVISRAANLHYYRTYFEKDDAKRAQAHRAMEWILRALALNPLHVELTVKYADTLGILEQYKQAVAILERLAGTPEAPTYIKQWLGYYLLFVPHRLDDSLRYSKEYLSAFPGDADTLFNVACAYAQKYCSEVRPDKAEESPNRKMALSNLRDALSRNPGYAEIVRTRWTQKGESFDCLASDAEFRAIVAAAEAQAPAAGGDTTT